MSTQGFLRIAIAALTFCLLVLGGCAHNSKQQAEQVVSQTSTHDKAGLLFNVPYSDVIALPVRQPDKIYRYGQVDAQQIWYYQASEQGAYKGLVILIHGGCWLSQFTIEHTQAMSTALADNGYAVWNIEYRSTGNGGEWPVALTDIRNAIAQLDPIKRNSLDLSKINIVGHSAGGHLAMLASAQPEKLGLPTSSIIKTIGLAPIVDIKAYSVGTNSCQTATPSFMGGTAEERENAYSQASVLNYRLHSALTYSLTGSKDSIVPLAYSLHQDSQAMIVEGAGHFDWIHPGTAAFKQLIVVLAK